MLRYTAIIPLFPWNMINSNRFGCFAGKWFEMERICHNSEFIGLTPRQQALDVFALKQVVNNGGLFCAAEIDILTGQRSGAVIIKLLCAVGGAWHLGDRGESVSLALDHIQPSTDLQRALMTKQFSRPKSCSSIAPDRQSLSYLSIALA